MEAFLPAAFCLQPPKMLGGVYTDFGFEPKISFQNSSIELLQIIKRAEVTSGNLGANVWCLQANQAF